MQKLDLRTTCSLTVIRQAARQVTQLYDRHLAPTGLRATQYSVLRLLSRHAPISVDDLAARVVMERTTMSRALRPLEREGLLNKVVGTDTRVRVLTLTSAGRELLDRTKPLWEQAQTEFEARYGADETARLSMMLSRVVVQMTEM